ncbi:MAG: 3-oxoacyl-[acyl-carrier-protein] reductase [Gemmatimonadales bacterium]
MIDLTGKTALVTGGSRGIGKAIATKMSDLGAQVAVVARDGAVAEDVARELSTDGRRALGLSADVSSPEQVNRAVSEVESQLARIDILVNNAGLTRDGVLVRMTEEAWDTVLDVNLKGAFNTIKAVARGMMKRRSGRIINVTSVVGLTGNRGQANYSASKAGMIGLTKAAAKELASRNILVNAIAPGFIDTDLTRGLPEAAQAALLQQIPLGRLGSTDNVADAVVFLASDLASYITGQVLVVDGGMVM